MALELKIKACFIDNCSKLELTDITGEYSLTNLTGWNTPNLNLVDVDAASVTITFPSGTTVVYDVTTAVQTAVIVDEEFQLDLIENTDLPDGIYLITYEVIDEDTDITYTTSIEVLSLCKVKCCIEKMKAKFVEEYCGCNWKTYWDYYQKASALLVGIKSAYACGKKQQAKDLLKQLEKICSFQKCCC